MTHSAFWLSSPCESPTTGPLWCTLPRSPPERKDGCPGCDVWCPLRPPSSQHSTACACWLAVPAHSDGSLRGRAGICATAPGGHRPSASKVPEASPGDGRAEQSRLRRQAKRASDLGSSTSGPEILGEGLNFSEFIS